MPGPGLDLAYPDLRTAQLLLGSALPWFIKHYLAVSHCSEFALGLGLRSDLVRGSL